MSTYARITDGVAVEVWTDGGLGIVPADVFVPGLASQFEPVPDEVQAGWRLTDGVWTAPPPAPEPEPPPVSPRDVDAERDRRISAGFEFAGVRYQSRLPSPERAGDWEVFSGKALEALLAVMNGAQPGDLRWSDPAEDFTWIAADNSRVPMDAQTVIELAKAASAHRSRHTFAGSDLKALDPIPADYTADHYWQ